MDGASWGCVVVPRVSVRGSSAPVDMLGVRRPWPGPEVRRIVGQGRGSLTPWARAALRDLSSELVAESQVDPGIDATVEAAKQQRYHHLRTYCQHNTIAYTVACSIIQLIILLSIKQ